MVVLCANASRLVEAVCDRIRYGIQTPVDDVEETAEDEPETAVRLAAATKTPAKPTAATSKTTAATKPAAKTTTAAAA
ncbi:hypothetical protein [Amycolatopsis stemonae]